MQIPITDAFDDPSSLERVETALTPAQIAWLDEQAEKQGLSFDHMLRTVITTQMRDEVEASPPHSEADTREAKPDRTAARTDSAPSLIENLRSAHERLKDLTSPQTDEAAPRKAHDSIDGIRPSVNRTDESEERTAEVAQDESKDEASSRSMFDLVEDE